MRTTLLVFAAFVLVTLQTSVLWKLPGVPALFIPFAIYLGYSRELLRGAVLAAAIGYIADVLGGGPPGLHSFHAILLSFLGSAVSTRFVLRGPIVVAILTLVATALTALLELALLAALYRGFQGASLLLSDVFPTAVATMVLAPAVFWLSDKIDHLGRKVREEKGLSLRA